MQRGKRYFAGFVLGMCTIVASAAPVALRSPWDAHPPKPSAGSYTCKMPDALPKDIVAYDFYSDSKHSVIDKERYAKYQAAEAKFDDVMHATASAADKYVATGNTAAAKCTQDILLAQARADAMTGAMASNQSAYVQNWTLGALATAWLKARTAQTGSADDRKLVTDWLAKVAGQTRSYFTARHDKGTNDGTNNHYYWAGFAVMGAGIAANDRALFDWGVGTFDEGASRIGADGTLPLEMARGQRALHYHLFAIEPLVMMAEYGAANGADLYARKEKALRRLVQRSANGIADNSYFAKQAGTAQDTPDNGHLKNDDLYGIAVYNRRFPDPVMTKLLSGVEIKPSKYLGGLPPA